MAAEVERPPLMIFPCVDVGEHEPIDVYIGFLRVGTVQREIRLMNFFFRLTRNV